MKPLYKTTIVIWTEHDPREDDPLEMELTEISQDATNGDSYCFRSDTVLVENLEQDPDWDGTEFFSDEEEEGEE